MIENFYLKDFSYTEYKSPSVKYDNISKALEYAIIITQLVNEGKLSRAYILCKEGKLVDVTIKKVNNELVILPEFYESPADIKNKNPSYDILAVFKRI